MYWQRETHTRRDGQTDRNRDSMIRVSVVVVAQRERQCSMQWMDVLCRDSMIRMSVPAERGTHRHRQTDRQTDRAWSGLVCWQRERERVWPGLVC